MARNADRSAEVPRAVSLRYPLGVDDVERIGRLIGETESDVLEFKEAIPPSNLLARILAAFANTRGGTLLLGVREGAPSSVVGVDADAAAIALSRALAQTAPRLEVKARPIDVEGKTVFAVDVPPAPLTATTDGLFVRLAALNTPASPEQAAHQADIATRSGVALDRIVSLAEGLARLTALVEELRNAAGWRRQLVWLVAGAVLGAVLGGLGSILIGH